ncbi:CU044_5270 family protein [Promicromonospora sukumoe]|uniref:CU044_5270 family protein n=1 Tax=Promicromonospora sukumoe TaxID=88382 RepID=UPI000367BC6A|nr:CU044_5270 family protein [Promicromonospora sukumoe]
MRTSTEWTGQEPAGVELDALRATGALLDPSAAEAEAAFAAGRVRWAEELQHAAAEERPSPSADQPDGTWPPARPRAVRGRRGRRPGLRVAVGLGVAASVVGGAFFAPTATLTLPWDDDAAVAPPGSASAAEVLRSAAARVVTGADGSWDQVRGDQFVYYSSTGSSRYEVIGGSTTEEPAEYRGWFSVDGTRDGRATATNATGDPLDERLFTCADGGIERARAAGTDCSSEPGIDLDAPTDVDGMYDYLRDGGDGSARLMFIRANDLLLTLTPEARAAVFGALSRVDGLTVTPGVVDAAGRPGIAVGAEIDGYRQDLIFDPETRDLLGGASVYPDGMADGYAVTGWTVVDEVGQTS